MKKKILFFHFNLGGGGAEKVLINLLNRLNQNKYEITLYTLFGDGVNKKYLMPKIKHKYLFKRTFHGLTPILRLFSPSFLHSLLIKDKYDVEIAYLENAPTRIISGCNNKDTKRIAWVHVQIDNIKNFFSPYRNFDEAKKCYSKFNKIIFVSEYLEKDFKEKTGWDFLPTQVIYNTIDLDNIINLSKEKSLVEIDKDVLNICSVGRLVFQKGYDRLFHILKRLKDEGFRFHFYLLGQGELYSEYLHYCKEKELTTVVTFCGYQDNPYSIISHMDLFVCSSRREGFSTAVSEAVLMNIPILTTNCSGMSEILLDGKYGKIVDNSEEALYEGLKFLMINKSVLLEYKNNMKKGTRFNTTISDVEKLIDE